MSTYTFSTVFHHSSYLTGPLRSWTTRIKSRRRLDWIHSIKMNLSSDSKSVDKRDHLATTAHQQRDKEIHPVTVTELKDISPTVKKVVLAPQNASVVQFKAGQWVDLFMPDNQVGGFSIVSSPTYLRKTGLLELAVKYSDWPSTLWIHKKCQVGSKLSIRIGGDFYFDPEDIHSFENKTVLFIAAGVGINPLASMIFHIEDLKEQTPGLKLRTVLLFSVKTVPELLFKEKFQLIADKNDGFSLRFFVTKERRLDPSAAKYSTVGRIKKADIDQALSHKVNQTSKADMEIMENNLVYICGPPPFLEDMECDLRSLGIQHVFRENWWEPT